MPNILQVKVDTASRKMCRLASTERIYVHHLNVEDNCIIWRDVRWSSNLSEGKLRRDRDLALLAGTHADHSLLEALQALGLLLLIASPQLEYVWLAVVPGALEQLAAALQIARIMQMQYVALLGLEVAAGRLLVDDHVDVLEILLGPH